jgi:hypothetical protein
MDENVIVTTFREDSRAHKARVKASEELPTGAARRPSRKVQAKLCEVREWLRHLLHR